MLFDESCSKKSTGMYLSISFVDDEGYMLTFGNSAMYIACNLTDLEKGNFYKRVEKYTCKEFEKLYHE